MDGFVLLLYCFRSFGGVWGVFDGEGVFEIVGEIKGEEVFRLGGGGFLETEAF